MLYNKLAGWMEWNKMAKSQLAHCIITHATNKYGGKKLSQKNQQNKVKSEDTKKEFYSSN